MADVTPPTLFHWVESGEPRSARWPLQSPVPEARAVVLADDCTRAADAYALACQGTALLWRGDFHNARQLLRALSRRIERRGPSVGFPGLRAPAALRAAAFHRYRQARAQRARVLNSVLVALEADYGLALRRAPDLRQACVEAFGEAGAPLVLPLQALLGVSGTHQWRLRGIPLAALAGERIHPHYGVFAPVRSEYVDLVAAAPLPAAAAGAVGFDIGTGTGVLAAVLARRGVARIVATDTDARALSCAAQNLASLGVSSQVQLVQADLYPAGRAGLAVCNPPWLPGRASSALERGIYDTDGQMLGAFLGGLAAHLEPQGEGWLVLSDLAEHLGLRPRAQLLEAFDAAGLRVVARSDVAASHPRTRDVTDPLHAARAAEVTSLWRLAVR